MNRLNLVFRSLRFYWRTHLGVLAGCALSASVLIGALGVGDGVRRSLERTAQARLGRVDVALDAGHRYFRDDLAGRLRSALRAEPAAALRVRGMALRDEAGGAGRKQVNHVEVLGADAPFFELAESPSGIEPGPDDLAVNEKLAAALGVKVGDEVALRIFKPGFLSQDAPLATRKDRETRRWLFTLRAVLSESQLGRFSLKSDQTSPYNAFVNLRRLQEILEMEGRANLIVAGAAGKPISAEAAQAALRSTWRIEDAELRFRSLERHGIDQLESPRIYLEPAVSEKALALRPDSVGLLSYLVNSVSSEKGRSTPYSFVTAAGPSADRRLSPVPPDMKDDQILVSRWLADHLALREGDRVKLSYSELTPGHTFAERHRFFAVRGILEMEALVMEKELMPEFPGLTDVENCKDWDIGLPMEERQLKDEANEAYWKAYRQTPKAFVTLQAGREMWTNRFGDLMAVRYFSAASNPQELRTRIDPADTGLFFRPVREDAMRAAAESTDLGQLLLGMSVFLMAASLTLTVMLFTFSAEHRAREMGTLLAVGYTPGQVKGLLLAEGGVLAVLGSLAGVPLGWGFAGFLTWGLGTAWKGAVAGASLSFHVEPGTAVTGAVAAAGISLLAMGVALWRLARRPIRQLVSEDFSVSMEGPLTRGGKDWFWRTAFLLATGGAVVIVVGTLLSAADRPAPAFFAAGSFMLIGGIALFRTILARLSTTSTDRLSVAKLGIRNAARRSGRSLATAGMIACGCFAVFSVSAMKDDLSLEARDRRSGTGGFELYGESSIALHHDLNREEGRAAFRLTDAGLMGGVSILPLKMREGDDASCLNLNLSRTPPLLGVDPTKLSELRAFAEPDRVAKLWGLLEDPYPDGVVPAIIGDSSTAVWKLKKKVGREDGDLLDCTDERGRPFKLKLVAALSMRLSVFQGRLLISNKDFTRLYPSESGYRVFLMDVPSGTESRVMAYLTDKLETVGLNLAPSIERVKEFYAVESTYLTMFLVLGGLGLLLGSAGMGVLVLRTVMERRGELALLWAVGYSKDQAVEAVQAEHRFLLAAGLVIGTVAAALAITPAVAQPGIHLPYGLLAGFLLGTAMLSLAWIWVAVKLALRTSLLPALRGE